MARSRSKADNQNQLLVIGLVLMVILCIGLGLMTYFSYSGQDDLIRDRDKYASLADQREKLLSKLRFSDAMAHIEIGDDTKAQQEAFRDNKKENIEAYNARVAALEKGGLINWDKAQDKATTTYVTEMVRLRKDLEGEKKARIENDKRQTKLREEIDVKAATAIARADALDKALKGTEDKITKSVQDLADRLTDTIAKLEKEIPDQKKNLELIEKLGEDKKKIQEAVTKLETAIAASRKEAQDYKAKLYDEDRLKYDQPKAKITDVSADGVTVYLNVGSADLVKPGVTTFSIFAPGTYKTNAKAKAKIEVTDVLADHRSVARVTEAPLYPVRDPIVRGDQLYNAIWTPGQKEHVAIVGRIDLGDGRDSTAEFVRHLEKMGVVVDAWLDFSTLPATVKGQGITREQTRYAIMADRPTVEAGAAPGDARMEKRIAIGGDIGKLEKDAESKQVTKVQARDFMERIGYKLPKIVATSEDWSPVVKPAGEKPAGGEKDMPKAKEMPKEKEMAKEKEKDK